MYLLIMSNNTSTINIDQTMETVESKSVQTEPTESKSIEPETNSKPVQNVWKKRFDDASKVQKSSNEESSYLNVSSEGETITGKGSGKGYTKNYGKGSGKGYGKGSGKGYGKGYGKGSGKGYDSDDKNESNGKGSGKGNSYKPKEFKEQTPEEKLYREEKANAFNLAQDIAIKMCVDRCNSKVREDVNSSISYEMNYRRILVMDITEDDIVVEVNGNKHVYSLRRFLENRYFQNNVRDEYVKLLPEAWIRLFPGRDEGTFCIGIQKKKD